jgi:hypothetical protein
MFLELLEWLVANNEEANQLVLRIALGDEAAIVALAQGAGRHRVAVAGAGVTRNLAGDGGDEVGVGC